MKIVKSGHFGNLYFDEYIEMTFEELDKMLDVHPQDIHDIKCLSLFFEDLGIVNLKWEKVFIKQSNKYFIDEHSKIHIAGHLSNFILQGITLAGTIIHYIVDAKIFYGKIVSKDFKHHLRPTLHPFSRYNWLMKTGIYKELNQDVWEKIVYNNIYHRNLEKISKIHGNKDNLIDIFNNNSDWNYFLLTSNIKKTYSSKITYYFPSDIEHTKNFLKENSIYYDFYEGSKFRSLLYIFKNGLSIHFYFSRKEEEVIVYNEFNKKNFYNVGNDVLLQILDYLEYKT